METRVRHKRLTLKARGKVRFSKRNRLPLDPYQYTIAELVTYYREVYGCLLNGKKFRGYHLNIWAELGRVPQLYGGHKITGDFMSGIKVYTVEGLEGEDYDSSHLIQQEREKRIVTTFQKREVIKPRRTNLYYQILGEDPPPDVLPDNWKDMFQSGKHLMRKRRGQKYKKNKSNS